MAHLELHPDDPDRVIVTITDREVYLVEQLPGLLHARPGAPRTAPKTRATWLAAQALFQANLQVGSSYATWLKHDYETRVGPCLAIRYATDLQSDPATPWDARLRPFQKAGVAFLATAGCAVLGDEMGTGKTVQSISALRRLHEYGHHVFPVLCVVPNSTKGQWEEHWKHWFPGAQVQIVGGTPTQRRKALEESADVFVINWEAVRLHSRLAPYGNIRLAKCAEHRGGDPNLAVSRCEVHEKELNRIKFRSVIVDEAHKMKDPHSKQTRAVWAVQFGESVRFRYSLTGTPIADHPGDLWPIMHGIAPLEYPTSTSFEQRYCLHTWDWSSGGLTVVGINPTTRDEFFGFFDPRFRRMPKALVLPYLPPVVKVRRDAPMGTKQAKAYETMRKKMMAEIGNPDGDDRILTAKSQLAKTMRLTQFANATVEFDEENNVTLTKPSPKVEVLLEVLEEASGQVIVCAESRKLIMLAAKRLEEKGYTYSLIVGGMTDAMRQVSLNDFKTGRVKVLLFTMKAGGEGLNMTEASTMVRLERSWSMLLNEQSVARFHRMGSEQHQSLTLVDVVAPGTIEERQFQRLREKSDRLEEITRDKITLQNAGMDITALVAEEQSILNQMLYDEGE